MQRAHSETNPAHLHAATSIGSAYTASYDAAGNMICRATSAATTCAGGTPTGASLSYDASGQLAHWQNTPSAPTKTADFLYDGEGNRVLQQSVVKGKTTTTASVSTLEDVTTSGSTTSTTAYYYLGAQRIAESVNGTVSYLASDGLGSAEAALSSTGTVTASVLYMPYGKVRYSSGTMPGAYGYTGQQPDALTGLNYDNARYYDPVSKQFITADTVSDGLNRYGYVGENPETNTDPSGHCFLVCAVTNAVQTVSSAVQTVSSVAQAVLPVALTVVGTVTGISSMAGDIQTIANAIQHGGSPWVAALAAGDLLLNLAMDASMFTGAGELVVGMHAAVDVGTHLLADAATHAVEDSVEHAAEDAAEHAVEDAASDELAGVSEGDVNYRRLGEKDILSNGQTTKAFREAGDTCFYCGRELQEGRGSFSRIVEHVYPNELAEKSNVLDTQELWDTYLTDADNLVDACRSCNSIKGYKPFGEWAPASVGFRPGAEQEGQAIWNLIADRYGLAR